MTVFESLLLGVIQGLTEFLPVSSSGHLVIMRAFLDITTPSVVFDLWLHLATAAAALVFFWKQITQLTFRQLLIIAVANIPLAVLGLLYGNVIEYLFSSLAVVSFALMISGLLNILSDRILSKRDQTKQHSLFTFPSSKQGLLIGLAQMIALVPGISRSGSTVFAGLSLGLSRESAFAFSFLMVMPAIVGATILESFEVSLFTGIGTALPGYVIGCSTAFGVGLFSLWLLKRLLVSAHLRYFGAYCFLVGGGLFIGHLAGLL